MDFAENVVSDQRDIRQSAMKYLAIREHSTLELMRKLLKKGYDDLLVHDVLGELTSQSLLSDDRFAEQYVRYRKNRGFGSLHIQTELRERGINEELISKHVDVNDKSWYELVQQVQQKRFGNEIPEDIAEKAKQVRFLESRGFTSDQIWDLIGDKAKHGWISD